MAKVGLITIISIVLNLFLTFWLINQYMSDAYFQAYVNGTIGQYYPFIVLTLGVGGGSGLGYLFLKRKHGDGGLISKIQKSKSFKPAGPLSSTPVASPSRQVLPTGAPPTTSSKHTAYAVPPLPKSSSPSGSRTTPGATWSAAGSTKSSLESILSKQDAGSKPGVAGVQNQRIEPQRPQSQQMPSVMETAPPQPLRSTGDPPNRMGPSWSPQQPPTGEKRPESGPIFQKPGMDIMPKQDQQYSGFPTQPQASQPAPVPSKWASPTDERPNPGQWSEGGVKSIPPLPSKWTPSQGSQTQPPSPSQPSPFPRPGPSPLPARGPIPPSQGGPRPFVIQGPGGPPRPGEQRPIGPPRPVAAPQPFRPDPNRPLPGQPGQQRPPQPLPRPAAPLAGPMPQPWTPSQQPERKEPGGSGTTSSPSTPGLDILSGKQSPEQKSTTEGGSGGGEMDWDTALDTILKTLRKDRVGDTK